MAFWMFMLGSDLLIPLVMVGFGCWFSRKAPAKINHLFGYRTAMSMKNRDTWDFAHRYCGRLWQLWGIILLPVTVLLMLLVLGRDMAVVSWMGLAVCFLQTVPLLVPIALTERALRNTFDEAGIRR